MPIVVKKSVLGGLCVKDAMRRQVVHLPQKASIDKSINYFIKYKVNALLTTNERGQPVGVATKTDIMGAFYASLPIESPLKDIMSSPPLFCRPEDSLEGALDKMRSKGIYRLYVLGAATEEAVGVFAYPDVVGLLYRYCHSCEYSQLGRKKEKQGGDAVYRLKVKEVMTPSVRALAEDKSLLQVMEELSIYRFGAVLIIDRNNVPCGVVSKTDLILAYKHGVASHAPAKTIMSSPVRSCEENESLEGAIQKMIFSEVHRLFVHRDGPQDITGVLSLSDAARLRSGSCQACVSSRIKVDDHN